MFSKAAVIIFALSLGVVHGILRESDNQQMNLAGPPLRLTSVPDLIARPDLNAFLQGIARRDRLAAQLYGMDNPGGRHSTPDQWLTEAVPPVVVQQAFSGQPGGAPATYGNTYVVFHYSLPGHVARNQVGDGRHVTFQIVVDEIPPPASG